MTHPMQASGVGRRAFLGGAGASLAAIFVAGCGDDDGGGGTATQTQNDTSQNGGQQADVTLDFSTPFAVLNYAYALEQLEAAFYTQVLDQPFDGIDDGVRQLLDDIRAHEVVHKDFFKAVLGENAIPALEPDFSKVDFADASSVLSTAQTFENLGVAAYNGAASLIDPSGPLGAVPLMAAGDIVSVEARHASAITALLEDGRGGFSVGAFDKALPPSEVLSAAQPFIKTTIALQNVPEGSQG